MFRLGFPLKLHLTVVPMCVIGQEEKQVIVIKIIKIIYFVVSELQISFY